MKPARILEVCSYPPPPSGWGVRVQFLKRRLEADGHVCEVLNVGESRTVPSPEYVCVSGGIDFVTKVWRYTRRGYRVHAHTNGHSPKGLFLATVALLLNRLGGHAPVLTFHGGADQTFFPRRNALLWTPAFGLAFLLASRIVCNNESVKAGIRQYGTAAAKIRPIPAFSVQYLADGESVLPDAVDQFFATWPVVLFTYMRLRSVFYPAVLLEALAAVAERVPGVGLLVCGVAEHAEPEAGAEFRDCLERLHLEDRVLVVDQLERGAFLAALGRSAVCVRTPTTDGVSASVLEALALRVPVVAAENGERPPGVLTYPATDAGELASRLLDVMARRDAVAAALPPVVVGDTLSVEADLLTGAEAVSESSPEETT